MTEPSEYRNNRAMYEADTTAMVKCCVCDEWGPEDEAIEYKGEWFDRYCARATGLEMCAWCGIWEEKKDLVNQDGDDYHPKCLDEMERRGR